MIAFFADKSTIKLICVLLNAGVENLGNDITAHNKTNILIGDLEMALELPEGAAVQISNKGSLESIREIMVNQFPASNKDKLIYKVWFGVKDGKIHYREVNDLYDLFLLGIYKHLPAGFFEFACYAKKGDNANFTNGNMEVRLNVR